MSNGKGGFIGQDGLNAPDEPTGVAGTAGNTFVSVAFTAPSDVGASAITGFRAQVAGIGTSGTSSPLVVTGLTNGTAYTANVWAINAFGTSSPSAASASFTPSFVARGVFGGGYNGSAATNTMDFISIASTGNASDFGNLAWTIGGSQGAGVASTTRGVFIGGRNNNSMGYITIMTTGNTIDFGNVYTGGIQLSSGSGSATRGIINIGQDQAENVNAIQYITIATTGNSIDFGDLTVVRSAVGAASSSTRSLAAGGRDNNSDVIDYVTIASAGNATDFGNMTSINEGNAGVSNGTRAVFGGGYSGGDGGRLNFIGYVTISSTGNATDFGDLTNSVYNLGAACSSTRGVFAGGNLENNVIQYVAISSTGNATDFGDLTQGRSGVAGLSNDHGGLA